MSKWLSKAELSTDQEQTIDWLRSQSLHMSKSAAKENEELLSIKFLIRLHHCQIESNRFWGIHLFMIPEV